VDQLAGHGEGFGAIGAPDRDEVANPAAHCDNADFVPGGYPRTREQAAAGLTACVTHLRAQFREAVESAGGLLDGEGRVIPDEVALASDCRLFDDTEARAKCATIEGLGRALHGAQDFYAHSNWADEADPARPIGPDNPPGLNRPGPSVLLDLTGMSAVTVPPDLATGCFVPRDRSPGVGACAGRTTHAALNKDNGLIDPVTGVATDPTTPRGAVRQNFAKAVAAAIAETRRQWQDFRSQLTVRYGAERAARMICALVQDDPVAECDRRPGVVGDGPDPVGPGATGMTRVVAGAAFAVLLLYAVLARRSRRPFR